MLNDITDKEWEKFGKNDAYFGVISCDKYRKLNLTEKNKKGNRPRKLNNT
jgi:hypothetical protein